MRSIASPPLIPNSAFQDRGTLHKFLLFTHNKWKKQGGRVPYGIGVLFLSDEQCSSLRIERSDTGVPEKYCAANFLGRGETNVANLKGLLANLFLLRNLFGRAGVPPTYSLFTLLYSLRESFFHANRALCASWFVRPSEYRRLFIYVFCFDWV